LPRQWQWPAMAALREIVSVMRQRRR
jgi:hypothetical protein